MIEKVSYVSYVEVPKVSKKDVKKPEENKEKLVVETGNKGLEVLANYNKIRTNLYQNIDIKPLSPVIFPKDQTHQIVGERIYDSNGKLHSIVNENDNVKIFIQPYLTGMTAPASDAWIELSPRLKQPVFHHPLTLMPGNQVMVVKELPFVQKIRVAEGKMRRYFIKGKINLQSLDLSSDVYVLQILSNNKTKDNN